MKTIPLSQGQVALVDDSDFEWLNQWKWYAQWDPQTRSYRAVRCDYSCGKAKTIYMHREILGCLPGQEVDHIRSGDTLNNQRYNLRACTRAQNQQNQRPQVGRSSIYKGVSRYRVGGKWQVHIGFNGRRQYLGLFTDDVVAARAYDAEAIRLFGEFALTNTALGLLDRAEADIAGFLAME